MFKEAMYFRELFNKYYQGFEKTCPYYWLPKWCGEVSNPSARVLNCYQDEMAKEEEKLEEQQVFKKKEVKKEESKPFSLD